MSFETANNAPALRPVVNSEAMVPRPQPRWRRIRLWRAQLAQARHDETGAVTAEYAILIMAAVAFAGLLVVIMRSGEVQAMLTQLVQNALNSAG
ncbi:Flp pilus assembly pilin Flp [Canibacter oris]|uniref:Flp pilus assembly pilin Flp n=2 Tax=Canibacter oris TaxID=1365628 RepID=A0A840DE91_9MICO|nr:Flp pilus assembly pilin Flp [Canibacter oris]